MNQPSSPSASRKPRSRAVTALIVVNVLVFLLWTFHTRTEAEGQFMVDNFLVSWNSLMAGRFWTLITSVFSHNMLWHLIINMMVLASFGPIMEALLGTAAFLWFYFIAGIISSVGHSAVSNFLLGQPDLPALGASGAIAGVVLLFSLLFPKQKLLIFGLIPIPAIWGALIFIGLDIWGLTAQAGGGGLPIGHGAHLGGALTGILYYLIRFRGRRFEMKRS